jgi:lipopolysaccharide export system protein LptC
MKIAGGVNGRRGFGEVLVVLAVVSLCGCNSEGPAIQARPQTITFGAAPSLAMNDTATVAATASSGLPVSYSSMTPTLCSVDSITGVVIDISVGTCVIAANQSGNTTYAPAPQATQTLPVIFNSIQTIAFGSVPTLSFGGTAIVTAAASSGLAVSYSSTTPTVCSVDRNTGQVTDLMEGTCIVAADQAGDANYTAAAQVTLTITVSASSGFTVPGAPTGVTATLGSPPNTVSVGIGATNSGGSPITGYTVTSNPAGLNATGPASPINVTCPLTCAGYAFVVTATNAAGDSVPSAQTDVMTTYDVVANFFEPDTQPRDSLFIGSYMLNSTTRTVYNLHGVLSESMTGDQVAYPNDNMTWLSLNNQLSSVSDSALGGLLVTTFLLPTTNTLWAGAGGNGWDPGTGGGIYYGFPGANPGNCYARIFVNTADPMARLTQAQVDKLAYADCTPGGKMGATCMTGTTVAGYGSVGTMSGYPVSQTTTRH